MSVGFLLVAAPLGTLAAAWSAAVAMRLRAPHGPHPLGVRLECTRCGGADSPPRTLLRLAGGTCRRCGFNPPGWVLGAQAAGAAVPAIALYLSGEPADAAMLTLSGWLLLAIWITDEVSLWIPHAFWAMGLAVGLMSQAYAGGLSAAAWRGMEAAVLVAALALAAAVARLFTSVSSVGLGDFGVLAFLAVVLGYDATLDALLITGILALGLVAVRAAPPRARPRAFVLATSAVLATLLFEIAGAVIAAAALGAAVRRGRQRARATALPLGALLAAGALILIAWTAPLRRPSAAAETGGTHQLSHRSHEP